MPDHVPSAIGSIFSWSSEKPVHPSLIIGSGLGIGIPMIISGLLGMIGVGSIVSIGTLAIANMSEDSPLLKQYSTIIFAIVADAIAFWFGSVIGNSSIISGLSLVFVTFFIALVGGMNRTFARCSSLILIFLIIGSSFHSGDLLSATGISCFFVIGEIWIFVLIWCLSSLFARFESDPHVPESPEKTVKPGSSSLSRQFRYWKKNLHTIKGWAYAIRISICVLFAEITAILLNVPRSYWIALVVVLVVHRNLPTTMSRISMRALGTCTGVVIASALMLWSIPSGLFILIITILALVRPYAKSRNYLFYTSVMTILILSLLEFHEPYIQGIIMDRLVNTLIGLFIASILGYAVWQIPFIRKSINPA